MFADSHFLDPEFVGGEDLDVKPFPGDAAAGRGWGRPPTAPAGSVRVMGSDAAGSGTTGIGGGIGGEGRTGPDAVLRAFMNRDGRLLTVPAKRAKRLVVLDHLAQLFEPGERYPEPEVNRRLRAVHDDVAMLRRYLVDEGFLAREAGFYWRSGGSVRDL
jgi:hypothetical protein